MSISVSSFTNSMFSKPKSLFAGASILVVLLTSLYMPLVYAGPAKSAEVVNINTASAEQLASILDGVGMSKAEAIVEHRKRYGQFKQVDSLESVKGIGSGTLEKNRKRIILK